MYEFIYDYLFNDGELRSFLNDRLSYAINKIKSEDKNYILNVNMQDYTEHLVDSYSFELPVIDKENIHIQHEEVEIDVSQDSKRVFLDGSKSYYLTGTKFTFYIPFTGDSSLFKYQPSILNYNPPKGEVRNQELLVTLEGVDLEIGNIRVEFDKILSDIEKWLTWVETDIKNFNQRLDREIESQINTRREKLLKDSNLAYELGFPLREIPGTPKTYSVPSKRKTIISKPSASTQPFKPEPVLSMENYEYILNVVQNMTMVMERSPSEFKNLGEEAIRQHFLVQLNGHYEGAATGETFNYEGKTDILIREGGKNIFIAECKFWGGAAILKDTIDQILNYLSWRDTKTAIFIFNRNKNFTNVLTQIPNIVKEHPNFEKEIAYDTETGFRFIFNHPNDKNRKLYLTLLAFDIPK
ncbi:hypothetical protein SAMN04488589_2052 [Methanolobus vulcani]|uniref:Uncharacterized protein n=1 Tax=Methanolobus vulcani TaxID=38026 RepID=A0A7Z7FF05_9EURY|nr:hypothetical protein [Methanolobus vulcani]SDG05347.1 hypothetical protein SAMN04488589_2052 [Methanolobus vulcani]